MSKKQQEELKNLDDSGDHVNLPDMRLFTHKMSDIISDRLEKAWRWTMKILIMLLS